jgi:hypothetical protein
MTTSSLLEQQVIDDLVRNYRNAEWLAIQELTFPRTEYHMRSSYGKYTIYKWEYASNGRRTSTTLVKKIDRAEAIGMMKLLKEPK